MQLIADSGSTNTQWCITDHSEIIRQFSTPGINPFYQHGDDILNLLETLILPEAGQFFPDQIFFYGAGCTPEKKESVLNALSNCFQQAEIEVESDLLGAARALFGKEAGIACILGTGSNSCYYDGTQIVKQVSPLGFILGDEGSGAALGKLLIADCLKNQLPEWLSDRFLDEYETTPAELLDKVYRQPFPNRFLAGFTPFIAEHLSEPAIFNLVFDSFDSFFVRNLFQYDLENSDIGFVGSIAWYFKDVLEIVASERNLVISNIIQNPIAGLIDYHRL